MTAAPRSMHVARIKRTYKGKSYCSTLIRRSFRVGKHVKHETLANLSHLPEHIIELIDRSFKGENFVSLHDRFRILRSLPHGHVHAVLGTIRRIGLDAIIGSTPSRQRDLVLAMVAERLLYPCSKLATTRHWHDTTLAEELGVADATADELYKAMDWLLTRQSAIEVKLARRHLREESLVLYDVSSSYYEGRTCPLARHGHDRDGKKGLPIIVYGLLADADGRPLAVEVYPGNTGDASTVSDQAAKLRERFGLSQVVLVGDRGMLTSARIESLRRHPGLGWISALRSEDIRGLMKDGCLNRSLFDEVNLAEIKTEEFPGERLIACFNPLLAERRERKREELMAATEKKLTALSAEVGRRTKKPMLKTEIALKAGRHVNRWKMAKHYDLTIEDGLFAWSRNEASIAREKELDGIYVIRTSEPKSRMSAAEGVRHYKRLARVEEAFRKWKGVDMQVRPIRHRVSPRVRAHIFVCMLAYYVEWEMRRCLGPLLFADEELESNRESRDPVLPAKPSEEVKRKKKERRRPDGLALHSFGTLLKALGTRTRNKCEVSVDAPGAVFEQLTELTPLQAEAYRLLHIE